MPHRLGTYSLTCLGHPGLADSALGALGSEHHSPDSWGDLYVIQSAQPFCSPDNVTLLDSETGELESHLCGHRVNTDPTL